MMECSLLVKIISFFVRSILELRMYTVTHILIMDCLPSYAVQFIRREKPILLVPITAASLEPHVLRRD